MFSSSLLLNISTILIATFILIIVFFKRKHKYWKNLGVESVEPSIPFGNVKDNVMRVKSPAEVFREFYETMKARKVVHAGFYSFFLPLYMPIDLSLVKQIMQTDFAHFTDHNAYVNEKDDPLTAHLFSLTGQRWKTLRAKLTPTFTSGKMKMMFPIIVDTGKELVKVLEEECQKGPIEAKDICARYTTDIIGNCAFGIECNSLKDPKTEFRIKGARLFDMTTLEVLSNFFSFVLPNVARFLGVRLLPKEATDFFWNIIKENTEYREKNGFRRNDAFQLLLDMKNNEDQDSDASLTYNELAAQAFIFFVGGFETSSSMMSFVLLELSLNEDVQDRLRDEINAVMKRYNNEITYESLADMKYLEMVMNETLRKYPPLPALPRECTKEYKVPNTDVVIPVGQAVFIPIQGIHYDPEYYPDPEKFDPMRFSDENRSKIPQFAFLPFGEGPRICLGMRFAFMQGKVGLISIVRNFKITINPKTEIPVKLDPTKFFAGTRGGIWMDLERIG
ncbi:Cytochrome P450 [Popillia japonica]|uniref:Cytochrome P450 n=1 Tax=Popillia japonica TaxID=7064 RepID=A0AAW1HTT5_POPJA